MTDDSVISTLCDLIRINSVNPAYAHGQNEEEIQQYIERFFQRTGIETRRQEILPGRANVIARLPGTSGERRLVLEAHVDTAGIEGMQIPPFDPVMRDGRLYGRGSCDTKAGLAAMMHALVNVHRSGRAPSCEVLLAAAIDEEYSYRGVLALCEGLSASGAIVAEPTELRSITASKGCLRWRVTVKGRAAHSSKPHLGVNAITRMSRLIAVLEDESALLASQSHPLVGSPTLNIGIIQGGTQTNIVPEECFIEIDRRLIPGESLPEVRRSYDGISETLKQQFPDIDVVNSVLLSDWPMDTAKGSDIVRVASEVLSEQGIDGQPAGVPFGSDASKLARIGIPSIILGPGSIDQAHTADEFVELDSVIQAVNIYGEIIQRF